MLACASTANAEDAARSAKVETGTHDGAAFRIDVPANWNHGLVVYYHGYAVDPIRFADNDPQAPQLQALNARGYAAIQSGYSATGWAIEQAFADTEKLRKYFIGKYGKPRETLVSGMSMGGALTVMTLEQSPDVYAGGLALCGAIEPSDRIQAHAFAMRAA